MIGLVLALCYCGLAALYLSRRQRSHPALSSRARARSARWLRCAGWAALALALAVSVATGGRGPGCVGWLGAMTVAGLALTLLLQAYRPALIAPLALVAPPLAGLVALLGTQ